MSEPNTGTYKAPQFDVNGISPPVWSFDSANKEKVLVQTLNTRGFGPLHLIMDELGADLMMRAWGRIIAMATELATVTREEADGELMPERITHGHDTIGAVHDCQEDQPCQPHSGVVVRFNTETRRILGIE